MINIIKLILLGSLFFLCSCSSSNLLKRAIKKDPSILETQTIKVPEIRIDTFYTIDRDTTKIADTLVRIFTTYIPNDTCLEQAKKAIPEIVHYISTEHLIKDTLIYNEYLQTDSVDLHLILKLWQVGQELRFTTELIDSKIYIEKIEYIKDKSFLNKRQEIFFGILFLLLVFLGFKIK